MTDWTKTDFETEPEGIRREYEQAKRYNRSIDLYENVKAYEDFYAGDQWRGLMTPDLPKVQLNFLQRVVSMCIARVVSDDFSVSAELFSRSPGAERESAILRAELDRAAEQLDLRRLHKENVRDAAVDGDACSYFWFDPDGEDGGCIRCEPLENTCVLFGNPYERAVQRQPYLILALKQERDKAAREAARYAGRAEAEKIAALPGEPGEGPVLCTVLMKFFKRNGTVWGVKCTENALIRPVFDTDLRLYPIAWMSWEKARGSYHGKSAIAGLLPNQIALNKAYSGIIKQVMTSGFPTLFYNKEFVDKWDGRPGRAVAVRGSFEPGRVASYLTGPGVDPSITNVLDNLVSMTKEFMGTSDATLGSVRPDNASAIVALQNADAVPMELHRQEFYSFIEQEMRILAELMRTCYGTRRTADGQEAFDFSRLAQPMRLRVQIGAATAYSEGLQVDTVNRIFAEGLWQDPEALLLYAELMSDKYLPHKDRLIAYAQKKIREREVQTA